VETQSKQKTQVIMEQQDTQKKIGQYLTITEKIQHIFTVQQGRSIQMHKLLESMMSDNSIRGKFVSKDELKKCIFFLSKIAPQWINVVNTTSIGILVKVHKNLNMMGYDLKKKIQDYFEGSNDTITAGHSAF
jgi:hypothetical protein